MAFIQIDVKWHLPGHLKNMLREKLPAAELLDPAEIFK
jgi:hypothetical protein